MKHVLFALIALAAGTSALAGEIRGPEPHSFYYCGAAPGTPRGYLDDAGNLVTDSGGCRFVPHVHTLVIPKRILDCPPYIRNDIVTFETTVSYTPYPHRHQVKLSGTDLMLIRKGLSVMVRDEDADHLFLLVYPGGIHEILPNWPRCEK